MAKYTPGPAVAAVSGSIGGTTFSHNRGGQYMRRRAIPTRVTSVAALAQKARIAGMSAAYGSITDLQKASWVTWAQQAPMVDKLGQQFTMSGHQAFVRINARLIACADAPLVDPPCVAAPAALQSLTGTWDIGLGTFEIAFTETPLAAEDRLVTWGAVVDSPGVNYVENLYKQVDISDKALATGYDLQTALEARWGTLIVGQQIFLKCAVHDSLTGLRSIPQIVRGVVVTT